MIVSLRNTFLYGIVMMVLISCSGAGTGHELKMIFTDSAGRRLRTLREDDFQKVDWENQCYYIKKPVVRELESIKLAHATIDLVFNDEKLCSWKVVTVYESQIHMTLILLCDLETGRIIMDDNICVGDLRYDYHFNIKHNTLLEKYLRDIKLIE